MICQGICETWNVLCGFSFWFMTQRSTVWLHCCPELSQTGCYHCSLTKSILPERASQFSSWFRFHTQQLEWMMRVLEIWLSSKSNELQKTYWTRMRFALSWLVLLPRKTREADGSVYEHKNVLYTIVCASWPESGILKMNSIAMPAVQPS